jgi:hypothetical protein
MSDKCKNKTCERNKICNPETGRCVLKTGKIGKELLKNKSPRRASPRRASPRRASPRRASPRRASPRRASDKCMNKKCERDKICNPETGRCVLKTGKIGKELLEQIPKFSPKFSPIISPRVSPRVSIAYFFNMFHAEYLDFAYKNIDKVKQFILSDNLYKTIDFIKRLSTNNIYFDRVSKSILKQNNSICMTPRWFYVYSKKDAKKFNSTYEFDNNLDFVLLTNVPKNDKDVENRPIMSKQRQSLYTKSVDYLKTARDCVTRAIKDKISYIFYEVSFILEDIPIRTILTPGNQLHRSSVILNFKNYKETGIVDVYYMETSIEDTQIDQWYILENIILESIKQDIEVNLGLKCNIITFDMDQCPQINIQGDIGTCALWSLFIFYIYVLYPNRKEIFTTLKNMSSNDRNILLMMFIYSIYRLESSLIYDTVIDREMYKDVIGQFRYIISK